MSDPALDAQARKAGYPDYETMMAYMRHRTESLRDSHTVQQSVPNNAMAAPPAVDPNKGLSPYKRLMRAFGAPGY